LVPPSQITEPDRVLHLLDELKIGRHAERESSRKTTEELEESEPVSSVK